MEAATLDQGPEAKSLSALFKVFVTTINPAITSPFNCLKLLLVLLLLASSQVYAAEKVILQLKWKHQFQFAGFYAAQMQGYFAEEGLDVEIREVNKDRSAAEIVLSGEAQYGVSDASLVLSRLRGQPLVILSAIFQHSPLVLLTLQSSHILSPLELKGKRVMYQKNIDDAVLQAMFSELGLRDEDHIHVKHNFDHRSLLDGRADAISAYITNQPFFFRQMGIPINILSPANYGIDLYGDMLFVAESYLKQNKQQVLAFRRASLKGWEYALNHQEETVDWILNNLETSKNREHLLFEAERTARLIQPELVELGYFSTNRLQRIADIYKKQQLVAMDSQLDGIDYRQYYTPSQQSARWRSIAGISVLAFFGLALVLWIINRRLKAQVKVRTKALERANASLGNYLGLINRYVMTSTVNKSGEIERVSDAFCQVTGYSAEEVLGKNHDIFHHPDSDPGTYEAIRQQFQTNQAWSGEVLYRGKDGSDIWLECELAPLLNHNDDIIGYTSVFVDITVKKAIQTLSMTDTLTGLANRRHLDDVIERTMASAKRYKRAFSVVLLDLDHFKRVNDSYGHLIGDVVIKNTGQLLQLHTRKSDIPGRWGGEEFLIVCPETDLDGAAALAETLRSTVYCHEFPDVPGQTCSFGVAQWVEGESFDDLLERTDRALYKAKEQGRNCVIAAETKLARFATNPV